MSHCFAVVLAAGGSSRMGRCKALLKVGGEPLVVLHVAALSACEAVVVVGHQARAVQEVVPGTQSVVNTDWSTTYPSDSLRLALAALPHATGVLVTPVDVPPAPPSVTQALLGLPHSAVPRGLDGCEGHPVWVTGAELDRLRRGPVDGGLRALLASAVRVSVPVVLGDDFDDEDAFQVFLQSRR